MGIGVMKRATDDGSAALGAAAGRELVTYRWCCCGVFVAHCAPGDRGGREADEGSTRAGLPHAEAV